MARPYARIRSSEPSVTTIIGDMLNKPGLSWAAARETAMFAVHHVPEWQPLGNDEAIDVLRRHHKGVWDGRAAMGTVVHAINEAWATGESVDLAQVVAENAADNRQAITWRGREAEVVESMGLYLDGLEKFWQDWKPRTLDLEYVVATPGLYVGTADWLAEIDGRLLILDLKTTAQQSADKGLYHDSWALQLAAYRYGLEIREYGEVDGRMGVTSTRPNYEGIDGAAVVHLRGDGDYQLLAVDADERAYDAFLHLCDARRWLKALGNAVPMRQEVAA